MVDDSPTPRPRSALPMAPRLQRSARLRNVLRSQPRVKEPESRAARSTRRRMKGNFFAFVAAQVLIAVVAFIVVTDYIADGPIRHEVSNILTQVAGDGRDTKSNQDVVVVVKPPATLDENSNQETTAIHEIPAPSEPEETPATEIEKPVAQLSLATSRRPPPPCRRAGSSRESRQRNPEAGASVEPCQQPRSGRKAKP